MVYEMVKFRPELVAILTEWFPGGQTSIVIAKGSVPEGATLKRCERIEDKRDTS